MDRSTFILQIGSNLKRLRKKRGFTQQQLAIDCEMKISQISRIEMGVMNTSISVLYTISIALEVDINEFFDLND